MSTPLAKKVFELFGQREVAAEAKRGEKPAPWPCEHCGTPAEIEDVCPSLDGTRMLTLWHCTPCQTWGVMPSTLREPPVWVSSKEQ